MLTPAERCEAYNRARAILVSHWIDLGRIDLRLGGRSLMISGILLRLGREEEPLNGLILTEIMDELRRTPGIHYLQADLKNWREIKGRWVPVAEDGVPADNGAPARTYRISVPDLTSELEPPEPPPEESGTGQPDSGEPESGKT
jgi:hypothetical protein